MRLCNSSGAVRSKMVSVDPFESTPPQRPPFCGTARCVQNFRLSEQMLVSLNIFISIHVSISKGMEVNPPPRGKGMTQCFVLLFFFCSYCRSHADTSRTTHGQIISSRRGFFFYVQLSVKMICRNLRKSLPSDYW